MQEIDELFGEGEGAPEPRVRTVFALLVSGGVLSLLGMACSAAPGGVLVLLAWMVVEKDMDRLATGYLPSEARPRVQQLHTLTLATLGVVIGLFALQGALFCSGFYEAWWGRLLTAGVLPGP